MFKYLTNKIYHKIILSGIIYVFVGYLSTAFAAEDDDKKGFTITQTVDDSKRIEGIPGDILDLINYLLTSINILLAHILGAVSIFLNTSIEYFVVGFSNTYDAFEEPVANAWIILRDVSNILIIALFFAVAIGIIIGSEKFGDKALLIKLFIAAVLINFSAFFVKVLIDLSNIVILFFYSSLVGETSLPGVVIDSASVVEIASQSFFSAKAGQAALIIANILKVGLFILYIFLFIYLAIAFILRFMALLFVIILSPIGVVAFFLNKIEISFLNTIYEELVKLLKFGMIWPALVFIMLNISVDLVVGSKTILTNVLTAAGSGADTSTVLSITIAGIVLGIAPLIYAVVLANQIVGGISHDKFNPAVKWGLGVGRRGAGLSWKGAKLGGRGLRKLPTAPRESFRAGVAAWKAMDKGAWKNPLYAARKFKSQYGSEKQAEEDLRDVHPDLREEVRKGKRARIDPKTGKHMKDDDGNELFDHYTVKEAQKDTATRYSDQLRFGSPKDRSDDAAQKEAAAAQKEAAAAQKKVAEEETTARILQAEAMKTQTKLLQDMLKKINDK